MPQQNLNNYIENSVKCQPRLIGRIKLKFSAFASSKQCMQSQKHYDSPNIKYFPK